VLDLLLWMKLRTMDKHTKTLEELHEIKEMVAEQLYNVELGTHENIRLWFAFKMVLIDIEILETNE